MRRFLPILILLTLHGCGGFRGGIESVPCVGTCVPPDAASHRAALHEIALPGMSLSVSLNNRLRTYQYELMLYVIPTYLNLWDEFQRRDAENLELTLQITAHESDVTIDPWQLVLTVDGKEFRPVGVWVNNLARERQVIDAYVKARQQASTNESLPIPRSSEWRDAVTASLMVRPHDKSPRFIVMFPVPLPSPTRTLSLDASQAISDSLHSTIPVIRFQSTRWSEGYS